MQWFSRFGATKEYVLRALWPTIGPFTMQRLVCFQKSVYWTLQNGITFGNLSVVVLVRDYGSQEQSDA